jgi:hypothetical protein
MCDELVVNCKLWLKFKGLGKAFYYYGMRHKQDNSKLLKLHLGAGSNIVGCFHIHIRSSQIKPARDSSPTAPS